MKTSLQFFTKKALRKALFLGFLAFLSLTSFAQSVTLTPSGAWVPSMTTTARTALTATSGQLVYDSTTSSFWYYNGTDWKEITSSAATNWSITGNSGTSSTSNFIGTSDNVSLNFRMNNVASGKIDSASYITLFGYGAGKSISLGNKNTFFGYKSGASNTLGSSNVAIGSSALYSNTIGNYNIAIGDSSLSYQTIGGFNTAVGFKTLKKNTTGAFNVAIGDGVLENNTTGIQNVGVGMDALNKNTTGITNSAFGGGTLYKNTTGFDNSAFGNAAMYNQTTANFNTALGAAALYSTTTGGSNTAVGNAAGYFNFTGSNNVFLGYAAGYNETGSNKLYISNSDTSSPLIYGDFSTKKVTINDSLQSKYFRMSNGGTSGYLLQSDANGNGTWTALSSAITAGTGLSWSGTTLNSVWTKSSGDIYNISNNVGIGTSLVSARLHVASSANTVGLMESSATTGTWYTLWNTSSGGIDWNLISTGSANSEGAGKLLFRDSGNVRMTIQSSNGNVGIGTSSPNNKLDIQSSSSVSTNLQSSGGNAYFMADSPSGSEAALTLKTYNGGTNSTRWNIGKNVGTETGSNAGSDFFINRYDDTGTYLGQPFSITRSSGQVTIGTLSSTTSTVTTENATTLNVSSALNVTGSISVKRTVYSSSSTISTSDHIVAITTTSAITLTLPSASTAGIGKEFIIKSEASTAAITISTTLSQTIDGASSKSISAGYGVLRLYADGSNWFTY